MKKYGFPLYAIGYITIITATVLFIIDGRSAFFDYTPYYFAVGVGLTIIGRYLTLPKPSNFRVRRLNNILAFGAILLIGAAYFMFKDSNACIIFLTISAFIDLFTSFRYPKEKENNK